MYACIDIGGTAIKVAVSDKLGNLKSKSKLKVKDNFEELSNDVANWIKDMKKEYEIEGLAISSPGAVDSKSGIVGGDSAVKCIHGPNLKEIFKEKTGLNVSIENDANCAALAEVFSGNARGAKDMMFLVCGTGIGGAIVKDGKIHKGKHLYGGEFGCMIMEEEDGKYRNFSECASTMSFVRKVRKHYKDDSYDGERIFKEASEGNEICIDAINTFYKNLAKGIFNLQHIYDPEIILIGGGISSREGFVERINSEIKEIRESIDMKTIEPKLDICVHKNDSNLIGALANYLNEYN